MLTRILYVEDDLDICEIAKISLEMMGGFTVTICNSGEQAIEAVSRFVPELIILDVMMPRMDGPTTYHALRKIPAIQNVPVIFMTAKVQEHEKAEYLAMGAIGVISKPFDPLELSNTLKTLWAAYNDKSSL
jgi:CheY-like chemotaxis protein